MNKPKESIEVIIKKGRTSDSLEEIKELSMHKDPRVRWSVAVNPSTPENILINLSQDDQEAYASDQVRSGVAENENSSLSVFEFLLSSEEWNLKNKIAANINCPSSILEKLSEDPDDGIRAAVASNLNAPRKILEKLINDEWSVQYSISENISTPEELLLELATEADEDILNNLALNISTPASLLDELSQNENVDIRASVSFNPKTSSSILDLLSNDDDEYVRANVAEHLNTPTNCLEKLSNDDNEDVRSKVATNINTESSILTKLSEDNEESVRANVALNPNTPSTCLLKLSDESNVSILERIASNLSTPIEILNKLSDSKESLIRWSIARNCNTPESTLEKLSKDKDSYIRLECSKNTNSSTKILEILSKDKDEDVAAIAYDLITNRKSKRKVCKDFKDFKSTNEWANPNEVFDSNHESLNQYLHPNESIFGRWDGKVLIVGQDYAHESLVRGEPYCTSGEDFPYDLNCKKIFENIPSLSINIYWMIKRTKDAQGEITSKMANEMRKCHKEILEYTLSHCKAEHLFLMGKGVAWEFDKMFNTSFYDIWLPYLSREWNGVGGKKKIHIFPHLGNRGLNFFNKLVGGKDRNALINSLNNYVKKCVSDK